MIDFNISSLEGSELAHIKDAMMKGEICGDRAFAQKSEAILSNLHNGSTCKLTTSCTSALEAAALALGIDRHSEVIVPSYTFVSTASAFAMRGATIRFADIRKDTLNIDETKLESLINERTRAIVPVHYAGVGCEMDAIMAIAEKHNLYVVEDNAHGLFGSYKGKPLGTFGSLSTLSFHETKNITCGEGGAIVVNDTSLVEKIEIIREKGTNRSQFFRGQVDKYSWHSLGSSYVMSDVLAAFLYGQLEQWQKIQAGRKQVWEYYQQNLQDWALESGIGLPFIPQHCEQTYHMFYLLMPSLEDRTNFMQHMGSSGVHTVFHYLPLEKSTYARSQGWDKDECPVSDDISDRLVRLPLYTSLSQGELDTIVDAATSWRH